MTGAGPHQAGDRDALVVAFGALVVIVGAAVILLVQGIDLGPFILVLSGPLVTGLVGFLLSRRVLDARQVAGQTLRAARDVQATTARKFKPPLGSESALNAAIEDAHSAALEENVRRASGDSLPNQ